jgi:hypothetical protein
MTSSVTFTPPITTSDDALYALLKGGTPVSPPPPPPPDVNTYPLPMPPNVAPKAQVDLGTGPDTVRVLVGNNGGNDTPNPPGGLAAQFVIYMDGKPIAGPLTCSDFNGSGGGQVFQVHGSWGPLPHVIGIGAINQGAGVCALFTNGVWYDLVQLGSTGGATQTFTSGNWVDNWQQPTVGPPPPPPAVPSQITALVDGVSKTDTLQNLVTATTKTLVLPAGTFAGSASIPAAISITGAGSGKTIIDGSDVPLARGGKGVLVPLVKGVSFQGLTIIGQSSVSASGGIREDAPGCDWTATDIEVHGAADGIGPTFASNIAINGANIHDNGAGDGLSHEMYFGGNTNTVALTNVSGKCGTKSTHALKTRAGTTNVTGGTFTGSADSTGGIGGSVVDVPDMGAFTMSGATLVTSAGAANTLFFGYGLESNKNAALGSTATLTNMAFMDNTGTGGILQGNAGTKLVLSGCTYTSATPPTIKGFDSVTGTITPATPPGPPPPPPPPAAAFPDRTSILMGTDFPTMQAMLAYFNAMAAIPIGASKPAWTHPVTVNFPKGEFVWSTSSPPPATDKLGISQDAAGYPLGTTPASGLLVTAAAGAGFRDNPNIRTTALAYIPTNGAAIRGSGGNAFSIIHLASAQPGPPPDYVTFRGLQLSGGFGGDQSDYSLVIEDCILDGIWIISGNYTTRNCLITGNVTTSYGITAVNCTITGQLYRQFSSGAAALFRNCIIITGGQPLFNPAGVSQATFDHCLTDAPNPPAGCTAVSAASLFMNPASDFRLVAGAPAIGAGIADPVNAAADISGKARAVSGAIDVGCWQT